MAALTLSGPVGYFGGISQVSGPLVGYLDDKNYVLRYSFTTPSSGYLTSVTFATKFRHYSGDAGTTFNVRVKITESATSHINAGTDTTDYDATLSKSGTSSESKSCTVDGLWLKPNTTYYLYLFPGTQYFLYYCYDNDGVDYATLSYNSIVSTYALSLSAGIGSSISVNRTSSPSGSTGVLSNGATIYYGDVLTITFGASTGYDLGTHTVNGSTFTSGGTHTVTAAVAVVSTAALKTFALSISAGTGSTITVKRSGTALSNGATIYYGDVLTITFGVNTGYNLVTHTVNGTAFTSGGTHTVTGAVTVVATASLKTFALSISAGTGSTITVKRSGTALSNGATIAYGDVLTISFAASTGYDLGTHTVNGSTFTSGGTHTVTAAVAVVSTAALKTFALSISAGTGSTITVKRSGTALSNGATIYYGDVLTITFGASTGYNLGTHTVNGSAFTSGGTHTVTAAVAVVATATVKSFTLSISSDTGSTITVNRTSSPLQGAGTGQLIDGATIYYNDVLTVTFAGSALYEILTGTLNGEDFASGGTHTVTGAVVVVTTTRMLGFVYLTVGGVVKKFRVIICHNSKWVKYRPVILHSGTDIFAIGSGDAIVIATSLPVTTDGDTIIIGGT